MSRNAFSYFNDGANGQAQATLAFLGYMAEGLKPLGNPNTRIIVPSFR